MPHAPIAVQDVGGISHPATDGGVVYLPKYRLFVMIRLGSEYMSRQAFIDTGAPTCVLPRRVWATLDARGEIEWLTDDPTRLPSGEPAVTAVLGGSHRYRLGRVRVSFDKGDLDPREVLAVCTDNPPDKSPPLLLGLADLMRGRSLLLQVSEDGKRWSAQLTEP